MNLQKAKDYVLNKKVFRILNTNNEEFYLVEANTGNYEVRLDKQKDVWNCTCPNVRNALCAHIKAAIILRGGIDGRI